MEYADAFVDEEMEPDPQLNVITNAIIGAAISVHKELGPGHRESIYENALKIEFRARKIEFEPQVPIFIFYRGEKVGYTRMDFIVSRQIIVEVKAIEALAPIHTTQCISYLKATKLKLAILINFNVRILTQGIKRVAY
jgi:GxxExxY protein